MFRLVATIATVASLLPLVAQAQDPDFTLSTAPALRESGFLQFIMPRFSLKTRIRPVLETDGTNAEAYWDTQGGQPVMEGRGQIFYLRLAARDTPESKKAQRFADWLMSEIGQRTVEQFRVEGLPVFRVISAKTASVEDITFQGDVGRGENLAFANCARCHEIGTRNLMKGIGSTPSFGLLRGLPDWQERFMTFYLRPPHPPITQIEGITEAFDLARPPTIVPLLLTDTDVEDILSFVAGSVEKVDLGAPLVVHQLSRSLR